MNDQLAELARPFPANLVRKKPGAQGGDYVEHAVISQRLLEVVGPYTFEIVGPIANVDGTVSGCLARLTVTIDGREVSITEVGDVDRISDSNAANLKAAASDALKRCAMRLGLGLHLWAQENYYLDRALTKRAEGGS